MYLRYSSSVVAPTQCSSPRASAGLSMLPASIAPSALPAPTMVCSSSMKTMVWPSSCESSFSTVFRRSSNSPRYLAPAISRPMSSESTRLPRRPSGTSSLTMRCARPSTMAVLPTPGSPISTGIVLGAALQHLDHAADLLVAADHRVELAVARALGEVDGVFLQRLALAFGVRRRARSRRRARPARRFRAPAAFTPCCLRMRPGLALVLRGGEQEQLGGDELVAALGGFLVGEVEQVVEVARDA